MLRKALILFCIVLLAASVSYAGNKLETKTSPNYLIVLVHGVNTPGWIFKGGKGIPGDKAQYGSDVPNIPDTMRGYGDLAGYLVNDLGLDGYVYYYTFSQRDGHIADLARELGDRNYNNPAAYVGSVMNYKGLTDQPDITSTNNPYLRRHLRYPSPATNNIPIVDIANGNGNCWLEQAKQDFKAWFKTSGPGSKYDPPRDPTEAEIPQKYILICHSMGGLVARQYLSSDYYNNDVAAIITIDSQHLGSDGAQALKRMYDSSEQWAVNSAQKKIKERSAV